MFGFGRKYPAYEYGADDDSIRRIDQAKLSKETAQGVFLAGSADNIGVIDLVKGAQGTIGSQMTPVKAGAFSSNLTMLRVGTFVCVWHSEKQKLFNVYNKRSGAPFRRQTH